MTAVTQPRSAPRDEPHRDATWLSLFGGGRSYVWLTLLALAIGAASLIYPSAPSYDPWSWLIWGREILHGHLTIWGGSSWKPLPVIFTTVFALFGSAQPNLWLLVARAGAALTVLMSARLAMRITWTLTTQGREAGWLERLDWRERALAAAPAILAGAIALVCVTLAPHYPGDMMLGYSEGIMTAAFLVAAERAWDGHHRQAFAIGIIPSLVRPEAWLFWGLYGLWLMWKDRGARTLVVGLALLMIALWIVPQKLGGGSPSGLLSHARHNHATQSAVNSSFPFWNELAYYIWPLALERIEAASLLLIAFTGYRVLRAREVLGSWRSAAQANLPQLAASLAGALGYLWWIVISAETQEGFAGNPRYAFLGVALVYVSGCAAYGWAAVGLAKRFGARKGRFRWRARGTATLLGAGAFGMLVVFVVVPNLFTHRMPTISSIRYQLRFQARLREEIASLVQRGGGPRKVMTCGSVMTNNFQVPMVAWDLDVPITWIQAPPGTLGTGRLGPNVVIQDADTEGAQELPTSQQITAWEHGGSRYRVFRTTRVTMYMDCSPYSTT